MLENKKISIIMGIYNCEDTIAESIQSILNQVYTNWELIIQDDCSTDKTYEIVKAFEIKYPDKISVKKNDVNLSLGPTLNKCLKRCTGELIARQDGDDKSHKDRFLKQVMFLNNNKNIDMVGTGMISFDENGIYGGRNILENPIGKDLMRGSTFAHATIMARKRVYDLLEGYSENNNKRGVEDYDLWFRFFEKGFRGYNIQEKLYYVREDKNAYKRKNVKRRINEINLMLEGCKNLKLKSKYYLYIIKPIIALIIPKNILNFYHRKKFALK